MGAMVDGRQRLGFRKVAYRIWNGQRWAPEKYAGLIAGSDPGCIETFDERNRQGVKALQNRATLLAHREQWVREPSPVTAVLGGLTPDEASLYADLVAGVSGGSGGYGPSVRLEQERVGFGSVERAIQAIS